MDTQNIPLGIVLWLLAQPGFIAVVVNKLKAIAWVSSHPRETGAILNFLATTVIGGLLYMNIPTAINQPLVAFIEAVATGLLQGIAGTGWYEWTKPKVPTT